MICPFELMEKKMLSRLYSVVGVIDKCDTKEERVRLFNRAIRFLESCKSIEEEE